MKPYLETTSVFLKDLGEQTPGRCVALCPLGAVYVTSMNVVVDDRVALHLPSGEFMYVPARDLYVIPVGLLDLVTGAESLARKHADQHAVEDLRAGMHEGEEPESEQPDLPLAGYR